MTTKLMPSPHFRAVNATTGAVLALGKVYTYQAGTSTPLTSYSDSTGGVANTNPVILDANGEAAIWLTTGTLYKIKITDASDVQQYVTDNVSVDAVGTLAISAGGTGATTKAAAFDALSPLTTAGDLIYGGASGTGTRLGKGSSGQLLHAGTTPSWSAVDLAADVTGTLPVANGGTGTTIRGIDTSSGAAISIKEGTFVITPGSAISYTLAAPTVTTDDYKRLRIVSTTAFAHTVTNSSPGFNNGGASSDVATLGGAIGDGFEVVAYQGIWYVTQKTNVTLA